MSGLKKEWLLDEVRIIVAQHSKKACHSSRAGLRRRGGLQETAAHRAKLFGLSQPDRLAYSVTSGEEENENSVVDAMVST